MVLNDIPQLPVDYVWISQGFKTSINHYGIDIGYKSDNPNPPIKAVAKAEVAIKGTDQYGGLYVVLRHKDMIDGKWVYTCYWHLASFTKDYDKGSIVERGHILGIMGKTGNATGKHLHFEFWISPENVTFSASNRSKHAVDPVEYIFAHKGQSVSDKSPSIKRLAALEYKAEAIVGKLLQQKDGVRYRTEPSLRLDYLSSLGILPRGEYTVSAKTDRKVDGYIWVKFLYENKPVWTALIDGYNILNTADKPDKKETENLEKELSETEKAIENMKTKISLMRQKINAAINELEE